MSRITLLIAIACCVLAGCQDDAPGDASGDETPATDATLAADSIAGDSVFDPSEERVHLPTSRIYFTLTNHDWYRRGEPLVHDGRPYEPEGMPVSASLREMQRAGEFQGVEYYVQDADTKPSVYVPVFHGYWQRFTADPSTAVAATDDDTAAAPPPNPDSSTAAPR